MASEFGKLLIAIGVLIVIAGILLTFGKGIPFLGKLPGDIRIQKDGFSFYFPLASCIVVSLVLTLVLRLFRK